ncbi:hypothetical protein [uncultured Campylobacter sp.]|nr:hypothetical protein [uncultured Campylobacter sp.]
MRHLSDAANSQHMGSAAQITQYPSRSPKYRAKYSRVALNFKI